MVLNIVEERGNNMIVIGIVFLVLFTFFMLCLIGSLGNTNKLLELMLKRQEEIIRILKKQTIDNVKCQYPYPIKENRRGVVKPCINPYFMGVFMREQGSNREKCKPQCKVVVIYVGLV